MQCFFERADGVRVKISESAMRHALMLGKLDKIVATNMVTVVKRRGLVLGKAERAYKYGGRGDGTMYRGN